MDSSSEKNVGKKKPFNYLWKYNRWSSGKREIWTIIWWMINKTNNELRDVVSTSYIYMFCMQVCVFITHTPICRLIRCLKKKSPLDKNGYYNCGFFQLYGNTVDLWVSTAQTPPKQAAIPVCTYSCGFCWTEELKVESNAGASSRELSWW